MTADRRIYLDNAATSWPKPPGVYQAVEKYLREVGAPAGRSAYHEAAQAQRLVDNARRQVAHLLHVSDPRRVIFTQNGTDSLNLALHGLLQEGDHVITSVAEHNSVLRPLRHLETRRGVQTTRVGCDGQGYIDPDDVRQALTPKTRMIALIHASNVTGALQPVQEVGRIAREHEAFFLVDAAQSMGHVAVHPEEIGAHLVAAPGHKGLLGPLGVGVLYVAPGVESLLDSVRQGGTGSQSEEDWQPEHLPDKYECGNHNVPALAGLSAGLEYLQEHGLDAVREHEMHLTARLVQGLREIAGIQLYGPHEKERRVGVLSINVQGLDCQEVAGMLDSACSIQVRAGLHCAPLMHQALGTTGSSGSGAIRFSLGPFNTDDDIQKAIDAMAEISVASN